MSNLRPLLYPNKSHRKHVRLPVRNTQFAEFLGIMLGDGGINNPWQAAISLHASKDREYANYIVELCSTLFGITPSRIKRNDRNTLILKVSSITIVDFLVSEGLPRGNKLKNGMRIPEWITKSKTLTRACIRGLIDTDGCIFTHSHRVRGKEYKNIGLSFRSHSPELIRQVAEAFGQFGIIPHITKRGQDVCLYRADMVAKYLKVFGTSNQRIAGAFTAWRGG